MKNIKQKYNEMSKKSVASWLLTLFIIIAVIYLYIMVKSKINTISYALSPPQLPPYIEQNGSDNYSELKQNWSKKDAQWFHHASQGTATLPIPYDWLIALEQPSKSPWLMFFGNKGKYIEDSYILRHGFIKGAVAENNPDGLPIGFAQTDSIYFPGIDRSAKAVGFTCAACHTSRLTHKGNAYVIEGGPAMTDLSLLTGTLGAALGQTVLSSKLVIFNGRFNRFAKHVLRDQYNPLTKKNLQKQLTKTIEQLIKTTDTIKTTEGFTRLDALNRIGNQVFSADLDRHANYHAIDAPVNYPHIWTTSWFDWVQYDASIMQPLVRNAGEALGVKAYVNTTAPVDGQRFASSIPYNKLFEIENLLGGKNPDTYKQFSGLLSPSWPVSLPAIDINKKAKGAALYNKHCKGCHLPPLSSPDIWRHMKPIVYTAGGIQHQTPENYLKLNIIPLDEIGTDPMQAGVLMNRTVDTTNVGLDTEICTVAPSKPVPYNYQGKYYQKELTMVPFNDSSTANFGLALGAFVQETNDQWMQQNYIPKDWWPIFEGERPNCLQVGAGYKARPLNGIWATAPFLHNGSIPTLDKLLSPQAERMRLVQLGSQEFDAKNVGILQSQEFLKYAKKYEENSNKIPPDYDDGYFVLDTLRTGNSNKGHLFEKGYVKGGNNRKGVIGPLLTTGDRENLIEYLKAL